MERERIDQERLERPGTQSGDALADPEVTKPDEDQATGSEGTGRLIGLGEPHDRRNRKSESPTRMPE